MRHDQFQMLQTGIADLNDRFDAMETQNTADHAALSKILEGHGKILEGINRMMLDGAQARQL